MPLIADTLLENLTIMNNACTIFNEHCISGISANENVCHENVLNSTAVITALIPKIGYINASEIIKTAQTENISVRDAALKSKLISEPEFEELITPESVCKLGN
jgi:aspartate ammonia-lyase